jgi:hypothetical protein
MSEETLFRDYGVVRGRGKFPDVEFPPKPIEKMIVIKQVAVIDGTVFTRFRATFEDPDNGSTLCTIYFPGTEQLADFIVRFGYRAELRF